ncbi:hypothetical protein M5E87_00985 [Flavonifractor plautii]|nr:hypothetical protein M5E87_00985 [Flavonifractor plautii]
MLGRPAGRLACAAQAVRRRCTKALFIVIGYLAQLVPWFFIGRITFAYHYFPSVLFLILALCYVFYSLSEQGGAHRLEARHVRHHGGGRGPLRPVLSRAGGHPDPLLVWDLPAAVAPLLALLIPAQRHL